MNPEPDGPAFESSQAGKTRLIRQIEKSAVFGALAFAVMLGLMRLYHPLLLARHIDRILVQCGIAALVTFGVSWLACSMRTMDD